MLVSFVGIMAVSCEKPGPNGPDDPETPVDPGDNPGEVTPMTVTAILAAEAGSTASFEIEAQGEWQIPIGVSAFTVSPSEGQAGKHIITVTAAETNTAMAENVYKFEVVDGGEPQVHSFFVIHRGTPAIELTAGEQVISATDIYVKVPYKGSFTAEDLKVESNAAWIGFHKIDTLVAPALLEDGLTRSLYSEGVIRFYVSESNPGSTERNATLSVSLGDDTYDVAITQGVFAISEPDFSREFFRTSLIYKISGTFCTACPHMSYHLDSLEGILPGRTIVANIHAGSGDLDWMDGRAKFVQDLWKEGYMPSAYFNNYGDVMGLTLDYLVDVFAELAYQASDLFPSTTGIAGSATLSGSKLSINLNIAAGNNATKSSYRLTVFLMEDGLYAEQAGAEYVPLKDPHTHDHVIRGSLSSDYDLGGEMIALTPGQVLNKTLEVDLNSLPSNFSKIVDINNIKVLAYVTYDDSYTPEKNGEGAVRTVEYHDFGYIVDNAAVFPVNGGVDYRYE